MVRHPRYLEIPWDVHWREGGVEHHPHFWRLIAMLTIFALGLIGVGVTHSIM